MSPLSSFVLSTLNNEPAKPEPLSAKERQGHVQHRCGAYLDLHFVPAENDGNVLTDTGQISVPVWNVLVGDTGCHVEHDNRALSLDIVTVSESTKFLLTGCVPNIKFDLAPVCVEQERVDFNP
jgi:hypothetical protein